MDAVPAHYLSDAVGEIDGHASDGKDQQRNEAGHPFFMLHDQGMKMVHGFDPMFQVPGLVGLLKQVAQNGQYIHNHCEKKKIPYEDGIVYMREAIYEKLWNTILYGGDGE